MTTAEAVKGENGRMLTELLEFVKSAERQGNYPANTAGGIKAALRLVSGVLTESEASSLDTFREHLDPIFQRVFNKNRARMSAVSLQTYRTRINTVLSDYEMYGRDSHAMAGWNRKVRSVTSGRSLRRSTKSGQEENEASSQLGAAPIGNTAMNRIEVTLRPNVKAIVLVPADLSTSEAKRLKSYIDASIVVTE